jgi:2-polyprenyl-3-methyl-5-hydroxy-6-metoxy-1,4-benzoquinol methylase
MIESHDVVWTPEKIAANWEFFRTYRSSTTWLFAKHAGKHVVERAEKELGLRGKRVLDFHAGPGDLLAHLFARGIAAQGVEPSESSTAQAAERFRDEPLFGGLVRDSHELADGSFDVVLFLEGIEHLLDDQVEPTLAEIKRLLAPGGAVFATAPNAEDIASTKYRCPDCGGIFHQYQHMRSLDTGSMARYFEAAGFRTEKSATAFWGLSPYAAASTFVRNRGRLPRPHLYYVGRV